MGLKLLLSQDRSCRKAVLHQLVEEDKKVKSNWTSEVAAVALGNNS